MDACANSGSRVILTVNGTRYSARSSITVRPTTKETEAESNQDGTLFVTTKAVPAEMEITFSDRIGLDPNVLQQSGCGIDVTAELIDMNRTYLFTKSYVVGRPEINTENGEISGLKVASAFPKQVNG